MACHLQFWHLNTLSIILFLVSLSTFFFSFGPDSPFASLSFFSLHFLCKCFIKTNKNGNKPVFFLPLLFLHFLLRSFTFPITFLAHYI